MQSSHHIIMPKGYKIAIADIVPYCAIKDAFLITRINVPKEFRNQGYGTKLLLKIIKDATNSKIPLFLDPSPSDGLTKKQLIKWYSKHGFKLLKNGSMRYFY